MSVRSGESATPPRVAESLRPKQAPHQPRRPERSGEPGAQPDDYRAADRAEHSLRDRNPVGTDRHADPDLTSPTGDRQRDHREDAGRGEQESECGDHRKQLRIHPLRVEGYPGILYLRMTPTNLEWVHRELKSSTATRWRSSDVRSSWWSPGVIGFGGLAQMRLEVGAGLASEHAGPGRGWPKRLMML